ncbi:ubiquinol-cytochrome C reductase [Rhizophagus irregularis]|uniref:Complex III subunit 9 n=3 Tax=Rhizophagus irregularis TaxID=588596 RepID=A0A2I1E0L8_9GLOM|nr:ubiquinol-cytochrome C reductase [Rhizophagus irregularis DAOM 181602=DAOM 197198]EXX58593.1 ubiquinol--cytochrome-c reductase subunit 9 [Rhizophagus irregularis DAOM 197198w]PKC10344.1 ubiquinol-cytochrome C reductase [Rhizophagus irregularis]PKC71867.1 ubiquinol-cytochrome C reductase [Rhizophagus irregularis]PKK75549.1 ubiquinol-cytochrome C reductase [Rhizophagus irregularis]PKY15672.1 ubiquinol-cytochrome C reductase [Rhizophagus irregularis]|eukprot:XP_025178902.1 ubiquinol-cytochrome C reductase [Rhizophagus irregularis DAOM 181602=DAOM 197198]
MTDVRNSALEKYSRGVYRTLFRRNSVFLLGIFASAFAFEMAFDSATDRWWDRINKGKQWKDIKDRFSQ